MGGTLTSQHLAKYAAAAAYLSRRDGGCGALTGGPSSELGIDRQGSRVSSITMADGTSIELGASIIFSGNERQRAHIAGDDADPNLERAEQLSPGKKRAIPALTSRRTRRVENNAVAPRLRIWKSRKS
eukprot:CAMPEP_0181108696 /NCGR_PEP_ID=MMETSP1071-20121207/17771_1 /TAXON_ID=35127 /ORGANISM="Thalassiosira sp., Strain NH16" /LENGTH=127 /DNA_ID=CAMNT_0023192323 /DNA_START=352 /DNA_END=736 /DNA_ORIENTATION=+